MELHRTLQTVLADYQQRKANHEQHLSRIQQRIYRIGTIRLLLFVAAIVGAIYFRHEGWTVVVPVIVVCLVPFLILMKVHDRLFYDKDYTQQLIDINANELAALDYRTDCFDGGKDFQDPAHPYSYDLDLFGDRSLFQYINRTSTYFGRQRLAGWFARPLDRKADIKQRQDAVRELTPLLDFRQQFQATGMVYKGKLSDGENLLHWAESVTEFRHSRLLTFATYLFPGLNALFLILGMAGWTSWHWLTGSFILSVVTSIALQKRISLFQMSYEDKLAILGSYVRQMKLMEALRPQLVQLPELSGVDDLISSSYTWQDGRTANFAEPVRRLAIHNGRRYLKFDFETELRPLKAGRP